MTDLERKIRKFIGEFCGDMCAEAAEKALVGVLRLHASGDENHLCVKNLDGYSIQAWYGPGEDCPTVVAIAAGFGLFDDGEEE